MKIRLTLRLVILFVSIFALVFSYKSNQKSDTIYTLIKEQKIGNVELYNFIRDDFTIIETSMDYYEALIKSKDLHFDKIDIGCVDERLFEIKEIGKLSYYSGNFYIPNVKGKTSGVMLVIENGGWYYKDEPLYGSKILVKL